MQNIHDQNRVASLLGISTRMLERYHASGTGPAYLKVGKLVRYRQSDVADYIDCNLGSSTSEDVPTTGQKSS